MMMIEITQIFLLYSSYRLITSLVNGCQIVVPKEGNYW